MDLIPNTNIRGTTRIARLQTKQRLSKFKWSGHMMSREEEYVERRMLNINVPGTRRRGRPERRCTDMLHENMKEVEAKRKDAADRTRWKTLFR